MVYTLYEIVTTMDDEDKFNLLKIAYKMRNTGKLTKPEYNLILSLVLEED